MNDTLWIEAAFGDETQRFNVEDEFTACGETFTVVAREDDDEPLLVDESGQAHRFSRGAIGKVTAAPAADAE